MNQPAPPPAPRHAAPDQLSIPHAPRTIRFWAIPVGVTLTLLAALALVMAAVPSDGPPLVGSTPLVWLGGASYGIFLVHQPMLSAFDGRWKLRHGPFSRRMIPPVKRTNWTLLVQAVDQFVPEVAEERA